MILSVGCIKIKDICRDVNVLDKYLVANWKQKFGLMDFTKNNNSNDNSVQESIVLFQNNQGYEGRLNTKMSWNSLMLNTKVNSIKSLISKNSISKNSKSKESFLIPNFKKSDSGIQYEESMIIEDNDQILSNLSEDSNIREDFNTGSFGTVNTIKLNTPINGVKEVAIKRIYLKNFDILNQINNFNEADETNDVVISAHREVEVMNNLKSLKDSPLIQYFGCFYESTEENSNLFIVSEALEVSLEQNDMTPSRRTIGNQLKNWDLKTKLSICWQIANQLDFLTSNGIVHYDIKPANIMLKNLNNPNEILAYIIDYGSALKIKAKDDKSKKYITPIFADKDVNERNIAANKNDVWAFGLTMACVFFGFDNVFKETIPKSIFDEFTKKKKLLIKRAENVKNLALSNSDFSTGKSIAFNSKRMKDYLFYPGQTNANIDSYDGDTVVKLFEDMLSIERNNRKAIKSIKNRLARFLILKEGSIPNVNRNMENEEKLFKNLVIV